MKPYETHNALDLGLPPNLEVRHYPSATQDYLAWQIGEIKTRPELQPVFDMENRVVGARKTGKHATIFHLQAWGGSLVRAKEMWLFRDAKEALA
jgi:hypothetical protein